MFREKHDSYLAPAEEVTWSVLRRRGEYRDETAAACRLGSLRGKFLLTADNAGGKTVLVSTLDTLFRNGASAFEGLAAETLWAETGRYRVLTLDFGRLYVETDDETIDIVAEGLKALLTENFSRLGVLVNEKAGWDAILTDNLKGAPLSSLVLLIDNLDRPILESLSDSDLLRRVDGHLQRFFEIVDSMSNRFRFVLLTRETPLVPSGLGEDGHFRTVSLADFS